MDAVNRRIATKMLIEAGRSSNGTQMILISPQALQGYLNSPGVKIIRIVMLSCKPFYIMLIFASSQADPERGQGTLATESMV